MRIITKDIQLTIDGSPRGFRLTKPDAFSGVEILRLLLRLQDRWDEDERNKGTVTAVPRTWNEVTVPDVTSVPTIPQIPSIYLTVDGYRNRTSLNCAMYGILIRISAYSVSIRRRGCVRLKQIRSIRLQ